MRVQAASSFSLLPRRLSSRESFADDALDQSDLFLPQFFELACPPPLGERAVVPSDIHYQIVGKPVRHLDDIHDAPDRLVMLAQILDLAGQVFFHRAPDTRIQELGFVGAIEIPV